MLLLGVEQLRTQAKQSFSQSISGTDLVAGARTSPIQLMLYAVFRLGDATHNIRWSSFQAIAEHPAVAWAVPISLGDSHRGFAVVGTSTAYFEHFQYGDHRLLTFVEGKPFVDIFDAVIGADVAEQLGYHVGDSIVLNHGTKGLGSPRGPVPAAESSFRGHRLQDHALPPSATTPVLPAPDQSLFRSAYK